MPQSPLSEAQRIEAAKKAKKKSEDVIASTETEIGQADLGAAAKANAAKKPKVEPEVEDSPIVKAQKEAAKKRAQKAAIKEEVPKEEPKK